MRGSMGKNSLWFGNGRYLGLGITIMFQAVIFDCDGVLIDSEALSLDLEIDFLANEGLTYDRMDFAKRFIGTDNRQMDAEIQLDFERLALRPFSPDILINMRKTRDNHFRKHLKAIEGAENSLLAWQGVKAVASSSGHHYLKEHLEQVNLAQFVYPNVYSAQDVARGKPSPDVFLHAAEKLRVQPAKCLVIEDSLNGVRAAKLAGMNVWGFLGGGHVWPDLHAELLDVGADEIVPNHNVLTEKLRSA